MSASIGFRIDGHRVQRTWSPFHGGHHSGVRVHSNDVIERFPGVHLINLLVAVPYHALHAFIGFGIKGHAI